jgi:hypothetical protein
VAGRVTATVHQSLPDAAAKVAVKKKVVTLSETPVAAFRGSTLRSEHERLC